MDPETKQCPFCAEVILAAAIKCKHCGEFLQEPQARAVSGAPEVALPRCGRCTYQPTSATDADRHAREVHGPPAASAGPDADGWAGLNQGAKPKKPVAPGKSGSSTGKVAKWIAVGANPDSRDRLSDVGVKTPNGLGCPKCGGTQFTAKRSIKAKVIGIPTVGVGALIAPKSQVKCVACGTTFKRG